MVQQGTEAVPGLHAGGAKLREGGGLRSEAQVVTLTSAAPLWLPQQMELLCDNSRRRRLCAIQKILAFPTKSGHGIGFQFSHSKQTKNSLWQHNTTLKTMRCKQNTQIVP